ncbi:GNAT family N-acetyltransferase [Brackiella oedipodis]|uniref:GNAT family N-acetyltransferase n=1 Tax=Brackiella oedipodis TaxID=124225 RepID=UPI00048E901D|nr:GNAT family N-acyltransferase [Brackiella oedipodis]
MQVITKVPSTTNNGEAFDLILAYADTAAEIKSAQKLRYDVYVKELNVHLPNATDGIDHDKYDEYCKHLIVVNSKTQETVGTYRVLTSQDAQKTNGFYTETEFDISQFDAHRDLVCECGRSCIHPDYRDGTVIMLLWTGLTRFLYDAKLKYMLGCASVNLADGGLQASQVWHLAQLDIAKHAQAPKAFPLHPYPLEQLPKFQEGTKIPALIKGYLKIGARICGEPAWDKDFNAADFPVVIDLSCMRKSYRKHFGIE